MSNELSWVEISHAALTANAQAFAERAHASGSKLGVVVKADGYGHGLVLSARAFLAGGADWLIVNGLFEAEALRAADITAPIHIVGPVAPWMAARVVAAHASIVVADPELTRALAAAAVAVGTQVNIHIKVETGNHRQGLEPSDALTLGHEIAHMPGLRLEGLATHYADIEDTTDHTFALRQLACFDETVAAFRAAGLDVPLPNSANSAATILWPRTHGGLVRVGIAAYGLWPSAETLSAALALPEQRAGRGGFLPDLHPALSWRARVMQVKTVPAGSWVGYGRTFRCTHATKLAIIPVGYHEGYDRRLSNVGHVLIDGVRAPVRGRVCMNMTMLDVSDVPDVKPGAVATLIGHDQDERISAETVARWCQTINYEIVSRIHPSIPRREVP